METLDVVKLIDSIYSLKTWIVLIIVSIFGMLGGLSHKLTSSPDDKTSLWGYIVVGAVASIAVLFVSQPADAVRLIALSIAAGYGGRAVLDALEARVKTAIVRKENEEVKEDRSNSTDLLRKYNTYAHKLHQINEEFKKVLPKLKIQSGEALLETLRPALSTSLQAFLAIPEEATTKELIQLDTELQSLLDSFRE